MGSTLLSVVFQTWPFPWIPNPLTTKPKKPWPAVRHFAIDIVVRRGALRRFHLLKQRTAHLPVNVIWDRRQQDRRMVSAQTSLDRRAAERRQSPSFTWTSADFVVAADAGVKGIPLSSTIRKALKDAV